MKKIALLLSLSLLLSPLAGCHREGDWFAPFRGSFCAEIDGEWQGLAIRARVAVAEGEAGREATVTFYAPSTLAGTVLSRDATGATTLCIGELCRPAPAGFGTFFALFPTEGEVCEVSLEGDVTTVTGAGFSFSLDAAGVPLSLCAANAAVRVVSFEKSAA